MVYTLPVGTADFPRKLLLLLQWPLKAGMMISYGSIRRARICIYHQPRLGIINDTSNTATSVYLQLRHLASTTPLVLKYHIILRRVHAVKLAACLLLQWAL